MSSLPPPTPNLRPAPPEHASDRILRYVMIGAVVAIGIVIMFTSIASSTGVGIAAVIAVSILVVLAIVLINERNNRAARRR